MVILYHNEKYEKDRNSFCSKNYNITIINRKPYSASNDQLTYITSTNIYYAIKDSS